MNCEICKDTYNKEDLIEHRGFMLCDDCCIAALQEGCGWAPFKEKFSSQTIDFNE